MSKIKNRLEEDMMFYPELFINDEGDMWDAYIPEITEHCKDTGKPVSDAIKEVKEKLKGQQ